MFASTRQARIVGVLAGYLADLALGDPRRGHPVALFGAAAAKLEQVSYRDARVAGAVHVGLLVAGAGLLGGAAQRGGRLRYAAATAAATWISLGGTSLARTGSQMAQLLEGGDVEGARRLLPSLCGRDPAMLDEAGLTRAALESVAENTSDAQVAPLLWAAVGGAPAVLVYRAVNTLDSMVGYRSPRYLRFGWAAARLDDVANYRRCPGDRGVGGCLRAVGRRLAHGRGAGLAPRRRPASQPQRRRRRGGVRRGAGCATRWAHPVPPRAADPADAGRRPATHGGRPAPGGGAVAGRAGGGRGGGGGTRRAMAENWPENRPVRRLGECGGQAGYRRRP